MDKITLVNIKSLYISESVSVMSGCCIYITYEVKRIFPDHCVYFNTKVCRTHRVPHLAVWSYSVGLVVVGLSCDFTGEVG